MVVDDEEEEAEAVEVERLRPKRGRGGGDGAEVLPGGVAERRGGERRQRTQQPEQQLRARALALAQRRPCAQREVAEEARVALGVQRLERTERGEGEVGVGGVRRPPSSGSLSGAARAPAGAKPAPMKLGGAKKPPSKNDIDLEAMLNG